MAPPRFPRAYQEVVVAAVLLLVFVAVRLRLDDFITGRRGRAFLDPDVWPSWLLTLAIGLCVVYLVTAIRRAVRWRLDPTTAADETTAVTSLLTGEVEAEPAAAGNPEPDTAQDPELERPSVLRLAIGFALLFGYLYLMGPVGFVPATLGFCAAFLLFVGERRWYVVVGFPILIVVVVLAAFTRLLEVPLPRGTGWWLYWSTFLY